MNTGKNFLYYLAQVTDQYRAAFRKHMVLLLRFVLMMPMLFPVSVVDGVTEQPDSHASDPLAPTATKYVTASQTTYAEEGYPNIPASNQRNLYVGYDHWYGKKRTRVYVKFNLPDLGNVTITSAKVQLGQYAAEASSSYRVKAYRVTSRWKENKLTWNHQPGKAEQVGSATFSTGDGTKSIDITELVRQWYAGTYPNYGVTIWMSNENNRGGIFCSRFGTSSQCQGQIRPRLKIEYQEVVPTYNTAWLTDEAMEGEYDTSVDTIRYFFQQHHSCLANPIQDVDGVTIDIPQLIHDAAVKYHINPKVIIATMQKEQSAITHCPEPWRLKLLMGAGSPTTAREQIDFGTSLFRAYMDEIDNNGQTRSGWKVGVAKTTQDDVSVTPATAAVASQFTYTPYAGANWGGNNANVGGVWLFWDAWYNTFHFDQPLPAPPSKCHVPYYSQLDSRWRNHPLRTRGQCSHYCGTIGHCGCTLTSATMLFRFYGSSRNPASLSDCMGGYACPFYWGVGARCSQGKAWSPRTYSFSWSRLSRQINTYHRPVIVGMYKYVRSRRTGKRYRATHWVLVYKGSGNNPSHYRMNDPGYLRGAGLKLSVRTNNGWHPYKMAVYSGSPICQNPTSSAGSMNIVPPDYYKEKERVVRSSNAVLSTTDTITGSLWLYEATEVTMTVQILANSEEGEVTAMKLWTPSEDPSTVDWEPLALFAVVPLTDEVHILFQDDQGYVSQPISTTDYVETEIAEPQVALFLPLILKVVP